MANENSIARLLQDEPLYRKIQIDYNYWHPGYVKGTTFQFFCEKEGADRTFKLAMAPEKLMDLMSGREYIEGTKPFKSDTEIDHIFYFEGQCQSCNDFKVHFLLHTFSEGEIKRELLQPSIFSSAESVAYIKSLPSTSKLMMRKLGQWPSFKIKPDNTIYNFLKEEDKEYYNKALICLSQSYGVAAFAYFRKIVESEIINMVEYLSSAGIGDTEKIKALLANFHTNRQMSPLIENLYQYLPASLKVLNDNPFKLLYSYLSAGLHNELTDDQCLGYAKALNKLLEFTIRKIKEEQSELKDIRSILGGLRKEE